ncbi:unnamed protein product [Nippostrongylus brasiliensis]|uniref:DUF1336 domain-containing protein n=1 Tax=Nippostrongylus brasiliensis TaxID=27835 RepID=A0A0N4Y118_NIPBR|nr:unnamed protein product [Nippostrongylus brasiliensis]
METLLAPARANRLSTGRHVIQVIQDPKDQSTSNSKLPVSHERLDRGHPMTVADSPPQFKGVVNEAIHDNGLSLCKLGYALGQSAAFTSTAYHLFIVGKVRNCNVNLEEVKDIQSKCYCLPESSDSVVRALTAVVTEQSNAIVGLTAALDASFEYIRTVNRKLMRMETSLAKTRKPHIHLLERDNACMGKILQKSGSLKQIRLSRYWVELGNSDEERKKVLEEKKRCRSIWEPYCRMALSRAMADVRQYVLKEDQLFPRPKCSGVNGPVEESSPVEWRFREQKKITIVPTLNVDGVKFKKLSRSESWPIYIRLEGLPFKEKDRYENITIGGIMFSRKPPTEALLSELFYRMNSEHSKLELLFLNKQVLLPPVCGLVFQY